MDGTIYTIYYLCICWIKNEYAAQEEKWSDAPTYINDLTAPHHASHASSPVASLLLYYI